MASGSIIKFYIAKNFYQDFTFSPFFKVIVGILLKQIFFTKITLCYYSINHAVCICTKFTKAVLWVGIYKYIQIKQYLGIYFWTL